MQRHRGRATGEVARAPRGRTSLPPALQLLSTPPVRLVSDGSLCAGHHMQYWMRSRFLHRRLVRFGATGALAAGMQLALLAVLTRLHVDPLPADIGAFIVAAQANFVLSLSFTWGDRQRGRLIVQWGAFLMA